MCYSIRGGAGSPHGLRGPGGACHPQQEGTLPPRHRGAMATPTHIHTCSEAAGYSLTSTPTLGSRGDRSLPSGTM